MSPTLTSHDLRLIGKLECAALCAETFAREVRDAIAARRAGQPPPPRADAVTRALIAMTQDVQEHGAFFRLAPQTHAG